MKHLSLPELKKSPKEIFLECIKDFCNADLSKRLTACAPLVETAEKEYIHAFPDKIHLFTQPPIPKDVLEDDLKKVYTQKFVPQNSVGRKYYNSIMLLAPHKICPICEIITVDTLDHYLAKSIFPLLVVAPTNLVPCCQRCNKKKLDYKIKEAEEAPFHPYFDDVSNEIWLETSISPQKEIKYYVSAPPEWPAVLVERIKRSFSIFDLQDLYGPHGAEEISENIEDWKELYCKGRIELLNHFQDEKRIKEKYNKNSWKAALYRALINQFSVVELWLKDM